MARVSNARAAEKIVTREPFDNNSGSLQGRRTFAGWGDLPEVERARAQMVRARVLYWIYSDSTPIAWITYDDAYMAHLPFDWGGPMLREHFGIVAQALLRTHRMVKG